VEDCEALDKSCDFDLGYREESEEGFNHRLPGYGGFGSKFRCTSLFWELL
jgi:hypothetical protein